MPIVEFVSDMPGKYESVSTKPSFLESKPSDEDHDAPFMKHRPYFAIPYFPPSIKYHTF